MMILFLFISFLVACFNDSFERWMSPGMIFERYGKWLIRNERHWWAKALGLCIYCFNVWCEMIVFTAFVAWMGEWELCWMIPAGAVMGNVWLARVLK